MVVMDYAHGRPPSAWSPMIRPCALRLAESSVFAVTSIGSGRQLPHDPTVARNAERMYSLEVCQLPESF